MSKTMWLVPIHRVNHWLFGVIDFASTTLYFLDPYGESAARSFDHWAFQVCGLVSFS